MTRPQTVVDPEFAELLGPLDAEERTQLEALLAADGCTDPLRVWPQADGTAIVLDGHNRLDICRRLNIPFDTESVTLPDRDAALIWIAEHQLGRRNLGPIRKKYLSGREYLAKKKAHGGTGANQYTEQSAQNAHSAKTADVVAAKYGVDPATVRRHAAEVQVVDAAEAEEPGSRRAYLDGEKKVKGGKLVDTPKRQAPSGGKAARASRSKSGPKPRTMKHATSFQAALDKLRQKDQLNGRRITNQAFTQTTGLQLLAVGQGKCAGREWIRIAQEVPYLSLSVDNASISITEDSDLAELCRHRGTFLHPKTGQPLPPAAEVINTCLHYAERMRNIFLNRTATFSQQNHDVRLELETLYEFLQQYHANYRGNGATLKPADLSDPAMKEGHHGLQTQDSGTDATHP